MSSIISTAQSGLRIAQAGLLVTSQNVSGASVDGFSRRDANAVVNGLAGNSRLLNGTSFSIEGFTRDYSRLLESQRLAHQGKTSYSETLVQATELLDVVVADENNSLAAAISKFFDAAGQMVASPDSIAYRTGLTHTAEVVVQRIIGTAESIRQVDEDSRLALRGKLTEVNQVSEKLAMINVKIMAGTSTGNFTPSADLLDERDRLLMSIQKLVGGQSVINANQTATHYLQGIPLVEEEFSHEFITTNLEGSVDQIQLRYRSYNNDMPTPNVDRQRNTTTPVIATSFISGGEVGGYLTVIRDFLPDLNRRLDAVSIGLVKTVNDISSTPIFGFRVASGEIVTDSERDLYLKEAPDVNSALDIYQIRDMLNPASGEYTNSLTYLLSKNLMSLAPHNANEWDISADEVYAIEALRSTFSDPIADIISTVGNSIATWLNDDSANKSVMQVLNDRRESVSGVNLDEEAANMVKFQQLYAASSKIIQTGNQMFDTLLAMLM
jgi:flagellar hook-associated protein 1 FlgK